MVIICTIILLLPIYKKNVISILESDPKKCTLILHCAKQETFRSIFKRCLCIMKLPTVKHYKNYRIFVIQIFSCYFFIFFFQTDSHVWRGCGSASWNDNIFYVVHLYANSRDFYDILKQIIM